MNIKIIFTISISWVMCLQSLLADESAEKANEDLVLVKVATLNTIDANKEFQKNVQLVQQQRALAARILSKMEITKDKSEKAELNSQFAALQQKLNENNQLMFKTYGFSLNRNYVLTVEKSHIHMWVTKDEAEAISEKLQSGSGQQSDGKKDTQGFRSLFKRGK